MSNEEHFVVVGKTVTLSWDEHQELLACKQQCEQNTIKVYNDPWGSFIYIGKDGAIKLLKEEHENALRNLDEQRRSYYESSERNYKQKLEAQEKRIMGEAQKKLAEDSEAWLNTLAEYFEMLGFWGRMKHAFSGKLFRKNTMLTKIEEREGKWTKKN